jgi:hypothetical protein
MKLSKLVLAVAASTVLFGALTATASARILSISNQQYRVTWNRLNFTGGFGTVECQVTLEGSLHSRTIAKVLNLLIGYITTAKIRNPCIRGEETILTETLPWHIRYAGFLGTLPNITGIRTNIIGAGFRLREPTFGATCLTLTTAAEPWIATFNRNTTTRQITSITLGVNILCRGSFEGAGSFSGDSNPPTLLVGGALIFVTLI